MKIHTTTTLPAIDRVEIGPLRAISATRTIIDLARARVTRYRLEAAIDSAIRTGASSPLVLDQRLQALRSSGQWGVLLLERLLVDSGGHSMLERRFLELVREAGLPAADPAGRSSAATGERSPGSTSCSLRTPSSSRCPAARGTARPAERARDAQRRNELQDAGQQVYEYTWEEVTGTPVAVTRTLTARLHAAGWRR